MFLNIGFLLTLLSSRSYLSQFGSYRDYGFFGPVQSFESSPALQQDPWAEQHRARKSEVSRRSRSRNRAVKAVASEGGVRAICIGSSRQGVVDDLCSLCREPTFQTIAARKIAIARHLSELCRLTES